MRGASLHLNLLCAAVLAALHGATVGGILPARADWTDGLRYTLANYAYSKAASPPRDFVCTYKGNIAEGCGCWNDKGNKNSGQNEGKCDQPPACLAYDVSHSGGFRSSVLKSAKQLDDVLKAWKVPKGMHDDFRSAVLFDSSTFVAFSLELTEDQTGRVEAHVGAARRDTSGKIFVGWVYGKAEGNLIQPRKRYVGPGDCDRRCEYTVGRGHQKVIVPDCGTKKRGWRKSETVAINTGLTAYAFAEAATTADRGRRLRGGEEGERIRSILAPQEAPVVTP